ncbi:MAG TPA: hypothetical protein VH475_15670, partial [Tepidisphaeraceae bacterium]
MKTTRLTALLIAAVTTTIATVMFVLPGLVTADEPGGSAAVAAASTATVRSIDPDARTVTLETS